MTLSDPHDELLDRIHMHLLPRTYVEIGVETGRSLALALPGTRAVGIDPAYSLRHSIGPGTQLFRVTSDDFFASQDLAQALGGRPVDLAYIDGMHQFEFALRDFMNLERYVAADSVILADDCYPLDAETATRERHTKIWSGDVWKAILVLKQYRPDLSVHVVKAPPTGLAIIRNLNPASTVLERHYQQIVDQFTDIAYEVLDQDKDRKLSAVPNDWNLIRSLLPAQPFRHGDPAELRRQRDHRPVTVAAMRGAIGRSLMRQLQARSFGRRLMTTRRRLLGNKY
jgi:methyltransferase family protein